MTYNAASSGQRISVAAGAKFDVVLPENPTTGFRWTLESDGEPACLLVRDELDPAPTDTPGGGNYRRWRFKGASGDGLIRLELKRRWEEISTKTFTLQVSVQ